MFKPNTAKLQVLSEKYPEKIEMLKKVFNKKTNIYIDCSNVFFWQDKLDFHIDFKRLRQLFKSFDNINEVKVYQGLLAKDLKSQEIMDELNKGYYIVRTKPVKIMNLFIDVSSIQKSNPVIIKDFIKSSLLKKLDIETIEFLNLKLSELNSKGTKFIKQLKCNFDVEIGSDMIIDSFKDPSIETFVLWSGDSDFKDPINSLINNGKKTYIFATVRRISKELNNPKSHFFEVKKIRELICWGKELC